jgi:hypothetical protein
MMPPQQIAIPAEIVELLGKMALRIDMLERELEAAQQAKVNHLAAREPDTVTD